MFTSKLLCLSAVWCCAGSVQWVYQSGQSEPKVLGCKTKTVNQKMLKRSLVLMETAECSENYLCDTFHTTCSLIISFIVNT